MREPEGWIDLTDFSKGIVHRLGSQSVGGSPAGRALGPDGAASIENTFKCIALPGGGIGPLPQQDWTYARSTIAADVATWKVQALVGAMAIIPSGGFDPRSVSQFHPVDLFLALDGFTGSTHRGRWYRDRIWNTGQTGGASADLLRQFNIANAATPATVKSSPSWMIHHYLSLGVANPVVVRSFDSADFSIVEAFPDPTSGVTVVTATPLTVVLSASPTGGGGPIVSHQGRLTVFGSMLLTNFADGPVATPLNNDQFVFSTPQTATQDGSTNSIVTQDSTSGVGCIGSISASDLLIVTNSRGAALVQGDLANPTVRRMPAVIGTGGTGCFGVSTPAGFIYGVNRGGIHAWVGETSQCISAQLPDDCWIVPGAANISFYQGRFALWQNWVLCPGNWLYDTTNGSWWRIDDPSAFLAYEWMVNPYNGYAYGNAPLWTDGGATMTGFFRGYSRAAGAAQWSWQSQPLSRTRQKVVEVREVELTAQGAGTVAITFTARDGTTQSQTLTLAGSTTLSQTMRTTFAVQGTDIKVRLLATGTGGSGGVPSAPVVHNLRIGYNERMHLGVG
jgi:hypothetical protein